MEQSKIQVIKDKILSHFGEDAEKYIANLDVFASSLLDDLEQVNEHPVRLILEKNNTLIDRTETEHLTLDIDSSALETLLISPPVIYKRNNGFKVIGAQLLNEKEARKALENTVYLDDDTIF